MKSKKGEMFELANGIYQWLTDKPEYKILVIGLDNAGKTTLLEQYKSMYGQRSLKLDSIIPTIGFNLAKIPFSGCELTLWDVGGSDRVRSIWNNYVKDADAVLFLVDSNDEYRFEEAREVLKSYVFENLELFDRAPVVIICNKQDLEGARDKTVIERALQLDRVKSQREIHLMGCSARLGDGIGEVLRLTLQLIKSSESGVEEPSAGVRKAH